MTLELDLLRIVQECNERYATGCVPPAKVMFDDEPANPGYHDDAAYFNDEQTIRFRRTRLKTRSYPVTAWYVVTLHEYRHHLQWQCNLYTPEQKKRYYTDEDTYTLIELDADRWAVREYTRYYHDQTPNAETAVQIFGPQYREPALREHFRNRQSA